MGTIAPSGWFYLEASDDEDPEDVIIVYACSVECRDGLWKVGPGKLDLMSTSTRTSKEDA
jgi:hypothetical protein